MLWGVSGEFLLYVSQHQDGSDEFLVGIVGWVRVASELEEEPVRPGEDEVEADVINVKVIGQRYELNNRFISVIAELLNFSDDKMDTKINTSEKSTKKSKKSKKPIEIE